MSKGTLRRKKNDIILFNGGTANRQESMIRLPGTPETYLRYIVINLGETN